MALQARSPVKTTSSPEAPEIIERAVGRALAAADANPIIPRDARERERLLRKGFIPWLAGVDPEKRSPRRGLARRDELPADVLPLIDLLIVERAFRSDVREVIEPGGGTHGSPLLSRRTKHCFGSGRYFKGWLEADFGRLASLEGVKRAARDWETNGRDPAWLAHRGLRLADAVSLHERSDIAAKLWPT